MEAMERIEMRKPLVHQVMRLDKKSYLEWISKPYVYAEEPKSAPLFATSFMESLTHTAWWVIPVLWLPIVLMAWVPFINAAQSATASSWYRFGTVPYVSVGLPALVYFGMGVFTWTLVEYTLHRFLFHGNAYAPDNGISIAAQFLLHGIHHKFPTDQSRLVMPPALLAVLATGVYFILRPLFGMTPEPVYQAMFGSGLAAYIAYDLFHYAHHHLSSRPETYFGFMKKYHLKHHFSGVEGVGFGVTSRFWDRVFGTEPPASPTPDGLGEKQK